MGHDKLKGIAAELITQVREKRDDQLDTPRERRARIKLMLSRILNKYGYSVDL